MIGAAMGLASRGLIPFPSSFACFLERAADFIRMAVISGVNVKLAGSHAGVSIGEDGPSQMALEDLAMMRAVPNATVFYPCDAVSAERLLALMAYTPGPAYMRTSRPKTPVIYRPDETFTALDGVSFESARQAMIQKIRDGAIGDVMMKSRLRLLHQRTVRSDSFLRAKRSSLYDGNE